MLRIAAIMVVRNGAPTLAHVLSHFDDNRIDVVAIDHGSVDETPQILVDHSPRPVIEAIRVPFDGVHRWRANLERKAEVASRLPHDWVIHVDSDEIMESPIEGETLREFIERIDDAGFDMIECDEFVFVPHEETADHSLGDFVATMRRYYHLSPPNRSMQRAIRNRTGSIDWAKTGGHKAGSERRVSDEKIRLRHYVGLSLDHLRQQYLGRVFGAEELRLGWHRKRVATSPQFVIPPPPERLFDLDVEGWCADRPESQHLMFNQPTPYQPPEPLESDDSRAPIPFVVGVGRSGTTLLRLMLDSHPDMAMTPETHWLRRAMSVLDQTPNDTTTLRAGLTSNDFWPEMQLGAKQLDAILARHDPDSPYDTLRSIYYAYADKHGAKRVGDKTPNHGLAMIDIARALPEARFIHLIRDGRDVAVSHRELWFGPGNDPRDAAIFWLWRIREMRQQAEFLPHYLEVRYEELVRDPDAVLRRIGEFIDLRCHSTQLHYYRRARDRLSEMMGRIVRGEYISSERRRSIHERTESQPDPSRIGRWNREMLPEEVRAFERVAGIMLLDLGYELSSGDRRFPRNSR